MLEKRKKKRKKEKNWKKRKKRPQVLVRVQVRVRVGMYLARLRRAGEGGARVWGGVRGGGAEGCGWGVPVRWLANGTGLERYGGGEGLNGQKNGELASAVSAGEGDGETEGRVRAGRREKRPPLKPPGVVKVNKRFMRQWLNALSRRERVEAPGMIDEWLEQARNEPLMAGKARDAVAAVQKDHWDKRRQMFWRGLYGSPHGSEATRTERTFNQTVTGGAKFFEWYPLGTEVVKDDVVDYEEARVRHEEKRVARELKHGLDLEHEKMEEKEYVPELAFRANLATMRRAVPEGLPPSVEFEFDLTRTTDLMSRPCTARLLVEIARCADEKKWDPPMSPFGRDRGSAPHRSILLEGIAGSGKSVTLFQAVDWARAHGWLVLYIPNVKQLLMLDSKVGPEGTIGTFARHTRHIYTEYVVSKLPGNELRDEIKEPEARDLTRLIYDTPQNTQRVLRNFLAAHSKDLDKLPLLADEEPDQTIYPLDESAATILRRCKTLRELASMGAVYPKLATDAFLLLRYELGLVRNMPVLIAVDDYNALAGYSGLGGLLPDLKIHASRLRWTHPFMFHQDLVKLNRGVCVYATTRTEMTPYRDLWRSRGKPTYTVPIPKWGSIEVNSTLRRLAANENINIFSPQQKELLMSEDPVVVDNFVREMDFMAGGSGETLRKNLTLF